ncbi:serine--tRNA ligase [Candidatus Gracilibacteria bacterium]|nr:serine--tRNA ligase [Candidatus Gracilibacteria bacterium]
MIDIKHLAQNVERYAKELEIRGGNPEYAIQAKDIYDTWKSQKITLDELLQKKNDFNKTISSLSVEEKQVGLSEMKVISDEVKQKESDFKNTSELLTKAISKIPNLSYDEIPVGKNDLDNPVVQSWGKKPEFDFEAKPYYELDVYKKYVDQKTGAELMGARGYFMRGEMAKFQKVLFNWVEQIIWDNGFEPMYVPLMLNEKTMTDIGNLPDFDGQLYEVAINEDTKYYLIPSSEQALMGYYAKKHVGDLKEPILVMANTTCFRKESGSYGKDQQGILRVHQFEKIEIDALCRPEDNEKVFALNAKMNEDIYSKLGLHFRAVEVCSGDLPAKHHKQIDYEAWFPGEGKFREVCSNGAASDYQTRGLKTTYDIDGQREFAWSLNCTAVTFRTGLAIMEQFQTKDGKVAIPEVLQPFMGGKTHLG